MGKRSVERAIFLADIITTAIEGGIGYWSQCTAYRYGLLNDRWCIGPSDAESEKLVENVVGPCAVIIELDDDETTHRLITIDTIAHGLAKFTDGRFKEANAECDAGYIDSLDADEIVQVALFGEVIYG